MTALALDPVFENERIVTEMGRDLLPFGSVFFPLPVCGGAFAPEKICRHSKAARLYRRVAFLCAETGRGARTTPGRSRKRLLDNRLGVGKADHVLQIVKSRCVDGQTLAAHKGALPDLGHASKITTSPLASVYFIKTPSWMVKSFALLWFFLLYIRMTVYPQSSV